MPLYEVVNAPVQIGSRRYEIGETIEHGDDPSASMMPLDAAGRAAKLRVVLACRQSAPGLTIGAAHRYAIRLARSLGAGELGSYQDYLNFIEAWIATQRAAQEA